MTDPGTGTGADPGPDGARLRIGDAAVARIAGRYAARVPGVRALRADLRQTLLGVAGEILGTERSRRPVDGVQAQVVDGTAVVAVTVVTTLGHNCRDLAAAVARAVREGVEAATGLPTTVTVTVSDVLLD